MWQINETVKRWINLGTDESQNWVRTLDIKRVAGNQDAEVCMVSMDDGATIKAYWKAGSLMAVIAPEREG